MKTAAETHASIMALAKEGFAHHEVICEGPQEWLCRAPGSSRRWFRVIVRPYTLIVWGDIGDWIVSHADASGLAWLKRAAADGQYPGYLLSKIRAGKEREFYEGDAWAWLQKEIAEGSEDASVVRDELDGTGFSHHEWLAAWNDTHTSLHDVPDFFDHGTGPLWLVQAMCCFVAHVDEAKAARET